MDRQLAERMVGAACLLAVLVLVVPAILDGNPDSGTTLTHPQTEEALDLRTHTLRLDGTEREPPVPTPRQAVPDPGASEQTASAVPPETPAEAAARVPVVRESPQPAPARETVGEPAREPAREPVRPLAREALAPPGGSPPAPSGPTAVSPGGGWIVQLGSFSRRENADRLAANLERKGFRAAVESGGGTSGTLFRVRAGPEPDRAAAEVLAGRLAAAGFTGGRIGRK